MYVVLKVRPNSTNLAEHQELVSEPVSNHSPVVDSELFQNEVISTVTNTVEPSTVEQVLEILAG